MYNSVRNIKPTRLSVSGIYPFRQIRSIAYESLLERDFITLQDANPNVYDIISQPVKLAFKSNGRTYPYTPDFLVLINHEEFKGMLVEVKPQQEWQAHWRKWSVKWKVALNWCKEHDFRFRIYDESRIYNQRFHNIKILKRYEQQSIDPMLVETTLANIAKLGHTTVQEYLSYYPSTPPDLLWHLLATGNIQADLNQALNAYLTIWINSNVRQ